jgi:hypothetical protein
MSPMHSLHVRPPTLPPPPRFPLRTLLLMVLALLACLHFFWRTHRAPAPPSHPAAPQVRLQGRGGR